MEETVVSRKEPNRAKETNPTEQRKQTHQYHNREAVSTHQHLECISLTLDKQTKTINNEA